MKIATRSLVVIILILSQLNGRVWENSKGQAIEAEFISQTAETVKIRRNSDHRVFEIPISTLSGKDQDYLTDLKFNTDEIKELREISNPKKSHFKRLQELAVEGNPYVVQVVASLKDKLYEGINYKEDRKLVLENLSLMRSFFSPLGEKAGGGDPHAFNALITATGYSSIRGFTADAFGIGAGKGSTECMEVLLNHRRYGILLSSTVFAMRYPAEEGNEDAIEFLAAILSNEKSKALWHGASQGLIKAANSGNKLAEEALDGYSNRK